MFTATCHGRGDGHAGDVVMHDLAAQGGILGNDGAHAGGALAGDPVCSTVTSVRLVAALPTLSQSVWWTAAMMNTQVRTALQHSRDSISPAAEGRDRCPEVRVSYAGWLAGSAGRCGPRPAAVSGGAARAPAR